MTEYSFDERQPTQLRRGTGRTRSDLAVAAVSRATEYSRSHLEPRRASRVCSKFVTRERRARDETDWDEELGPGIK
ncbi:unnamed protein product [Lampetra planeri]